MGRAATTFIVALESKAEKDTTAILHGAQRRQADDVPQQLMDGRLRRTKKPDVLPREMRTPVGRTRKDGRNV